MTHQIHLFQRQQGFVLVTAMVLLIAITGVALSLMSTSSMDIKMTVFSQEREQATLMARGQTEQAVKAEVERETDGQNYFTIADDTEVTLTSTDTDTAITVVSELPPQALSSAGHTLCFDRLASSRFKCNKVRMTSATSYGKGKQNQVRVITGITQQVN